MEDKIYMENILNLCKGVADLYLHGTLESPTPNVRAVFHQALCETLTMKNEIFAKMTEKGWYPVQQVEQEKIQQLKQKYMMDTTQG